MPIFIPDLFTGYINGRRAAIQDNWQDAKNYNEVMKGQLDNAIAMQTMADSARKSNASANVADMNQTIAGARTDNELDLLNKQRANNLNALKAQLEAIQAQFNIDLTQSDEYKKFVLGQAAGQTTVNPTGQPAGQTTVQPTSTTATGQPTSTTDTNNTNNTNNLVLGSTTVQLTPEQQARINALNLSQEELDQFNTYLGGLGPNADVDAAIDNMERTAQEKAKVQENRNRGANMTTEEREEDALNLMNKNMLQLDN